MYIKKIKCKVMALEVTDDNLEEVLESEITVLDFWAGWCGPCRMVGPVIDQLAEENPEVPVGKVNVDENPRAAAEFGIRNIPAVLFFKDGKVVDRLLGAQSKGAYQSKIDSLK
jgi:thioredoxin 1